MGKKSKRKSNKSSPCYHGCITKKDFNFGGHFKILDGWDHRIGTMAEFFEKHKRVIEDPTFGRFVIARITDDYLKGKDDTILLHRLNLLLLIRYIAIPQQEGKDVESTESEYKRNFNKYSRDMLNERGRINIMAREIPCECMKEKRIEAKLMAKVAVCYGCMDEFLKEKMLRCKGCGLIQYCSKECSITHWPEHREECRKLGDLSARKATPASVPSSFEKPSDVDAEEE